MIKIFFASVLALTVIFAHAQPIVSSLNPADDASNVTITETGWIYMTFDRPVLRGTGIINIRKSSDNSIVASVDLGWVVDVKVNDANVQIIVPTNLAGSYYVEIPATAFKDQNNNYFPGFSSPTDWNFSVQVDNVPPAILQRSPANNATAVFTNTLITLAFDENLYIGGGNIEVRRTADDAIAYSLDVASSAHVQVVAKEIRISVPLETNQSYYITIPGTAVKDVKGNFFAGIASATEWTFTTAPTATQGPAVISLNPADDATGITTGSWIYMTFDRNVYRGSGVIKVKKSSDNSVVNSVDLSYVVDIKIDGPNVQIIFPSNLNGGSYYVEVPNTAFKDAANSYFAGFSSLTDWNFTSNNDNTPPSVTVQSPGNNQTDVPINTLLQLTFDEGPLGIGNGVIQIRKLSDDQLVYELDPMSSPHAQVNSNTLKISVPLEPNTSYYITIPPALLKDVKGNFFSGYTSSSDWQFTTSATILTGPSIVSSTPPDNGTNIAPADWIYIQFDRPVERGSGVINLKRLSDNSIASSVDLKYVIDAKINGDEVQLLLPMSKNEKYYLEIPKTAFKDVNNNYFSGISTSSALDFTMQFDAPSITSFAPATAAQGKSITVQGTNFHYVSNVAFGGVPAASFVVNSPTSISAVLANGASGSVSLTTPGGTASKSGFTFLSPPTVTSFFPASAAKNEAVEITGSNFFEMESVFFGDVPALTFETISPTKISAVVPNGAGGEVSVTTLAGKATRSGFTFIPEPVIASFSPTSAVPGVVVEIVGTNFNDVQSVIFGSVPAMSYTVNSSTSISAIVAEFSGEMVAVTTRGGKAQLGGFSLQTITGIEDEVPDVGFYPNPVSGRTIFFKTNIGISADFRASMVDLTGKIVADAVLPFQPIIEWRFDEADLLPPGIYFVHLNNRYVNIVQKLIVQRIR